MSNTVAQPNPGDPNFKGLGQLIGRQRLATIRQQYGESRVAMAELASQAEVFLPEEPAPSYVLSTHGNDCELVGDWAGVEAAYRAILDWPGASAMDRHSGHRHLMRLCEMLGRDMEALAHSQAATRAIRLPDLEMLLVMALAAEADCLLRCNQIEQANACIDEMFSLIPAEPLWDHLRARAHMLRAKCDLARGSTEQVETNVQRALELTEPQASWTDAASIQATIAACWAVRAQMLATRADRQGAVAAWREAVRHSRLTATEPRLAGVYAFYCLAKMLCGLSAALEANGCLEESRDVAKECSDMLTQLGLPLN